MSKPLISVIIPIYNSERYLKQCLDSVINQTYNNMEIICINDGSADNSLNILNEYAKKDNRIKIISQDNQGGGFARNVGIKIATGEYLFFLDSDDWFKPTFIKDMYSKAKKDDSDIVMCGYDVFDNKLNKFIKNVKISNQYITVSPFSPRKFNNSLFNIISPNPWTKIFKRELFTKYDLIFENYKSCDDLTCVCLALALSKKISIINKSYINYRYNQTDNQTANVANESESFFRAVQALKDKLKKFNLYNTFKKAFELRVKTSFTWENNKCNSEQKNKRKIAAKKILSDDLYKLLYGENNIK